MAESFQSTEKNLTMYKEIADGFKNSEDKFKQVAGQVGGVGLTTAVVFGTSGIPVWGQLALTALVVVDLVHFFANLNPDDGIGKIDLTCSAQNNYCLGTRNYLSQFNGNDDDSAGDYDLTIKVEQIGGILLVLVLVLVLVQILDLNNLMLWL